MVLTKDERQTLSRDQFKCVVVMVNKPRNLEVTHKRIQMCESNRLALSRKHCFRAWIDELEQACVSGGICTDRPRLFNIGRLDKKTSGMGDRFASRDRSDSDVCTGYRFATAYKRRRSLPAHLHALCMHERICRHGTLPYIGTCWRPALLRWAAAHTFDAGLWTCYSRADECDAQRNRAT